jgi:hypothetical protein
MQSELCALFIDSNLEPKRLRIFFLSRASEPLVIW